MSIVPKRSPEVKGFGTQTGKSLIFGPEDILINNIAWFLRRFPVFTVFGSGDYRIQPVLVEDMAEIAVSVAHRSDNVVIDAVGPEILPTRRWCA